MTGKTRWSATVPVRTLLLLACTAAAVYFALGIGQRTLQIYRMQQERAELEQEIGSLHIREQRLLDERERLLKNQDIERIARQELNLIKPGETAVIVYPTQDSQPTAEEAPATAGPSGAPDRPWFQRLFFR